MNDLKEFWIGLAASDKHLDDRSKWARFIHLEIINRIKDQINSVLDYGCGGGWVSSLFHCDATINLVDLCFDSLTEASDRMAETGHKFDAFYHFTPEGLPDRPYYGGLIGRIDLLICTLVINHFPDYAYFTQVADFWTSIKPKYMLLHQRHSDQLRECGNIEEYKLHYGTGLLMPTRAFLAPFITEYEPIFHVIESETFKFWGTPGYEYVLLKRRAA